MVKKPPPPPEDWEVLAVHHVVDGDTQDYLVRRAIGVLDQFTIISEGIIRVRVVHLQTPEEEDGEPYIQATNDASAWLYDAVEMGLDLRVTTQGKDSFGRYLGDVYLADDRAVTLTDHMVRELNWPVFTKKK